MARTVAGSDVVAHREDVADRPGTRAATRPSPTARRYRPRGWVRHYAGLLAPRAAAAMPVVLERNTAQRLRRAALTAGAGARERVHGSRGRMRALRAAPGARLRWSSVPAPANPGARGAIVHPIAAATCDIDCPLVRGATPLPLPLHLGHECVAEVLSVGELVSSVRVGDRVVVPFQVNCGLCDQCLRGRPGACSSVPPLSMYGMGALSGHFGGAFSDQLAVPFADAMLVPLPQGIDPVAAASVSDNICDAYRHIGPHLPALLAEDADAQVLIIAGTSRRPLFSASCPLYTGLIARALGAREVTLVDSRADVRAHAERLGLTALRPRELRRHRPARLVAHISDGPLALALAHTAADGVCTSSGGLHRSAALPFVRMWMRRVTLHVSIPHVRALMPAVLELMQSDRFEPADVVTCVAPLDDAPAVLREHVLSGATKTVLVA